MQEPPTLQMLYVHAAVSRRLGTGMSTLVNGSAATPHDWRLCLSLQHVDEMEGSKFAKLCRDSKLLSKAFTASDVDLYFAKVRPSLLSLNSSSLYKHS